MKRGLKQIGRTGWAASLLGHQLPAGSWASPGTSPREIMRPRFASTHWVAIVLADLGMNRSDPRIRKTAEALLRWRSRVLQEDDGELCIAGNATRTLIRFGYLDHPVVQKSIEWLVQTQKADGGWTCFPRNRSGTLDGWEGLAALAEVPEDARGSSVRQAIERGAEFFLTHRLMREGNGRYAPWFRIHYPNHFYYDVLVGLRLLTALGYGADPRLRSAVRWLRSKRDAHGTWSIDGIHPLTDREEAPYAFGQPVFPLLLEAPYAPSQWATVEALSVLRQVPGS